MCGRPSGRPGVERGHAFLAVTAQSVAYQDGPLGALQAGKPAAQSDADREKSEAGWLPIPPGLYGINLNTIPTYVGSINNNQLLL